MAMAILTSRPNSHPFEERRVLLTESAKIGRSVAKSRPAPNNCIFECKVLSRNHAILWYENEKFFLRDTKSSNGTFVNNVRLSKGSEESEPKEINSGDIVQFGVDVVENSKKVTHGCIIANITLYLPNGNEATRSSSRGLFKARENGLPAQELWQLSQYLQDALYREQMLENRLTALQRLIHSSQNILDDNCQKFAQEDKLLSRLEMLENQIEALTRNLSEDDIKRRLLTLQEDRHNYEMRSKESLKRMLQEKLEAVQKLSEVERSCSTAEDECLHYKTLYEKSQQEMKELTERHAERLEEMRSLQEQVEEAERRHAAVDEQANEERREFESNLEEARKKEAEFAARAEAMQAECDFAKEQLIAMKAQLDKRREGVLKSSENKTDKRSQDSDVVNDKPIESEENLGSQLGQEPQLFEETAVFSNEVPEQSSSDDLKILQAKLKKLENEVALKEKHLENFKGQLTETQAFLKDSKEEVEALNEKLSKSREEAAEDKLKISKLEEEVMEYHLQAVDQLTFTDGLEQEDQDAYSSNTNQDKTLSQSRLQSLLDKILKVNSLVKERRKRLLEWTESEETILSGVNEVLMVNSNLQDEKDSDPLKQGLEGMQNIEDNFSEIEKLVEAEHEGGKQLKGQLSSTKKDLKVKEQLVGELQEELKNAQAYTKDFKQQILDLRDKLLEEQELTRKKDEYLASLRREINELSRERDLMQVEKNCEHQAVETAKNAAREMQKQAAKSAETAGKNKVELSAITEDNLSLKQKIQTLESELKRYRRENNRLSADYTKLQGSYRDLELQSRTEHEKQLKQQHTLRNKMEREVQEKQESIKQASSVGEKLQSTEETMKVQEAEWRKNIEQEKEKVSKMQSYLLSLMAVIFAMILAYTLDFISVSRGGRLGGS